MTSPPRESASRGPGVIRAVHDLGRRGQWPTAAEIAAHLKLDQAEVDAELKRLRERRIFDVRTRQKRRVWMPWGQA